MDCLRWATAVSNKLHPLLWRSVALATFLTNLNRRQGKRKALTASHRERHAETVHRLRKGENNEEHGSLVWLLHSKRLNPRTGAEQNVCTAASATWILLNSVQQNWTSRFGQRKRAHSRSPLARTFIHRAYKSHHTSHITPTATTIDGRADNWHPSRAVFACGL